MNDTIKEAQERRERIATAALAGALAYPGGVSTEPYRLAAFVVKCADALIAELDKEVARLRAENARLREAMLDIAYSARTEAHEDTVDGKYVPYRSEEYAREFGDDLFARLDAAKGVL